MDTADVRTVAITATKDLAGLTTKGGEYLAFIDPVGDANIIGDDGEQRWLFAATGDFVRAGEPLPVDVPEEAQEPSLIDAFDAAREAMFEDAFTLNPSRPVESTEPAPTSALQTQIGGDHYKSLPIQPMEYSMANRLDACQHTIVKYVTRFREKGGLQDLEKAKHCIDLLMDFERRYRGV